MYETLFFTIRNDGFCSRRGSEIDEKSMPKRLQDKIDLQEAKITKQVFNIGLSWRPISSQVASKSKVKKALQLKECENAAPGNPGEIATSMLFVAPPRDYVPRPLS